MKVQIVINSSHKPHKTFLPQPPAKADASMKKVINFATPPSKCSREGHCDSSYRQVQGAARPFPKRRLILKIT